MVLTSIFTISLLSYYPSDVGAEYGEFSIPEISGTITIAETSDDYSDDAKIVLSVAMAVAENSVENGKAMWGKLDVIVKALNI